MQSELWEMAFRSSMAKFSLFSYSPSQSLRFQHSLFTCTTPPVRIFRCCSIATAADVKNKAKKEKKKNSKNLKASTSVSKSSESSSLSSKLALVKEKRRTRSTKKFDENAIQVGDTAAHIPVMLAEVLDVFSGSSGRPLRSFVDCTVGAGGHSSAIIQAHAELKFYMGMDVDPIALDKAQDRISALFSEDSDLKAYIVLKNFKYVKSLLADSDEKPLDPGVDGILMDLGMSSMQVDDPERGFGVLGDGPLDMRMDPQASLKAEDILNSWPEIEVGRILRVYGEESNWYSLQNKIVKARSQGGLHSTAELVDLIRKSTLGLKGGRQGWIKTATRVFQALRIAVNDELNVLEDTLYTCFDCLAPGGRLAVISFHSLEDRVVKQTFLDIINPKTQGDEHEEDITKIVEENEGWIKQTVIGSKGTVLTKRPITPSEEEERLNRRSRSAKLRVIQKKNVMC
ncbi:ribosomal RNA small subunit methyltransferase H [Benincasa hispida]|uniref:ribosomal RNA small subunit methyltransferase H n=1 Tax=Benincasa hispida TaxID=102211 RepID=UPI001902745D|nr:ribosomal RNA small subunit methyltransferase H [Benincasa hispida]